LQRTSEGLLELMDGVNDGRSSQALNAVHVTGGIFFNAEFAAPWGFAAPHADKTAHVVSVGAPPPLALLTYRAPRGWTKLAA
jgi:hypothetical protein